MQVQKTEFWSQYQAKLFFKKVACQSEANYKQQCYKQQCMVDGAILYHAHIGLNDWPETQAAQRLLQQQSRHQ